MKVYDEVLGREEEVQEDVTPENEKEGIKQQLTEDKKPSKGGEHHE